MCEETLHVLEKISPGISELKVSATEKVNFTTALFIIIAFKKGRKSVQKRGEIEANHLKKTHRKAQLPNT